MKSKVKRFDVELKKDQKEKQTFYKEHIRLFAAVDFL